MDGPGSDTAATGAAVVGDYLKHHGVKGMKWGVRKASSSSRSTSSPSADHQAAEAIKSKLRTGGIKSLANHELQTLNTRMQLEANHRNLAGNTPSTFDKGHGHIKKVLAAGKTLADVYNTVNSPAGKAIRKAVGA